VFCLLAGVAVLNLSWFALRQPETLSAPSARGQLLAGVRSALAEPAFVAGTLGAGCVFGAFITYLSTAQSIFADVYGESARFPLLFAALALALGAGSLLNARRLRVRPLRQVALRGLAALVLSAAAALAVDVGYDGAPPLALFMLLMGGVFFVHGPSFGNLTALALQPLGRRAGLAASLSGSLATAIGFVVGRAFGASYAGRVTVVHVAFLCAALVAFAAVRLLGRRGE
jgi:MFS transporter, DHA1 family, multidrug resistance protein